MDITTKTVRRWILSYQATGDVKYDRQGQSKYKWSDNVILYPPHGPPPPYYTGHGHPPPPGGSYTYVPTPVMMPVYQPPPPQPPPEPAQPQYVTNYIYQQSPHPPPVVTIIEDPIQWIPATTSTVSSLTHKAYVAGKEGYDGSPLCIIRSHISGEFIPGKLAIKHRSAYVPHGCKEVPVHNFEVLCCPPHAVRWLHGSDGQVPVGAISAGNDHNSEPLYIGRVHYKKSLTPGKVHPSHGCCYISFDGSEIAHKSYEVLCRTVG